MPNAVIACDRNDGGGAQIHGKISVLAFCHHFNFAYLQSKIKDAHFSDGQDWDLQWNDLFGLNNCAEVDVGQIRVIQTWTTLDLRRAILSIVATCRFLQPVLFRMESAHLITDTHPGMINEVRKDIRRDFGPVKYLGDEEIVIHLRQGDDLTAKLRYESDSVLYSRLRVLHEIYPERRIRVYTNVNFDLDEDFLRFVAVDSQSSPFQAISHMAAAEVLIIAKSSMSYVAGLLSEGVVYAPDFWHPLMPDWINVTELGNSSTEYSK